MLSNSLLYFSSKGSNTNLSKLLENYNFQDSYNSELGFGSSSDSSGSDNSDDWDPLDPLDDEWDDLFNRSNCVSTNPTKKVSMELVEQIYKAELVEQMNQINFLEEIQKNQRENFKKSVKLLVNGYTNNKYYNKHDKVSRKLAMVYRGSYNKEILDKIIN